MASSPLLGRVPGNSGVGESGANSSKGDDELELELDIESPHAGNEYDRPAEF